MAKQTDTTKKRKEDEDLLNDVLASLLAGSQFGGPQQGNDLSPFLNQMQDLPARATERSTDVDPAALVDQFRNQEFQPKATGVPYIFTGGSPFPQSEGQQRAEKVGAAGALASNSLDSLNSVIPAIIDAWRKRKQGGP